MPHRLAVDIGGTFVDAIQYNHETNEIQVEKAATTEEEPTKGVYNSIEKLEVDLGATNAFIHGTTLGVNALLEREGARTGIITNEGFRDIFELGRHSVPGEEMYNIKYRKPEILVPRRRRLGVPERIDADGNITEPLDQDAVQSAADTLVDEHDVSAIAICFLNSYLNETHEQQAAEVVKATQPDVSVSTSTAITREYREYERTSTTVLDAYIKPIFDSYIDQLDETLHDDGFDGEFFVTRSGGGALNAENAKQAPVHTIFSGPAGGLIGSTAVGETVDQDNLIAVDMGGTSLDACVLQNGMPAVEYEAELEHLPLMIPVYDIRTIGAGGGSVAWLDRNLLKVGPKSAGAEPGPICYGHGGTEPTVTDAAVVLGYLDPANFLGGEMDLDVEAAERGIQRELADPLSQSVGEIGRGIFDVLLANTVSAVREITVEKGLDPREFPMIAYGGAGPMFVPLLSRELGTEKVIVPQAPGVFSAWGMLMADTVYDFSQTHITLLEQTDIPKIEDKFSELEQEAADVLFDQGYDSEDCRLERSAEMRYHGQEHTVEIPIADLGSLDELRADFEALHQTRYGHQMNDPTEIVHLRVRGIGLNDKPAIERPETVNGRAKIKTTEAYCFAKAEYVPFGIYDRGRLATEDEIVGPAIITEPTTTTVFYSDQEARVDEYGHLIIERRETQ